MAVNISAKFGKDSELYNGLDSIADELLSQPHKNWTAIVTLRPKFAKEDLENGGITPTIKVLQIEPIIDEKDAGQAKQLQIRAFKRRTGNTDAPNFDPPEPAPSLFDDEDEDEEPDHASEYDPSAEGDNDEPPEANGEHGDDASEGADASEEPAGGHLFSHAGAEQDSETDEDDDEQGGAQ